MDGEAGFCNDADGSYSSNYFKPYDRIVTDKMPTFKCNTKDNLFTTSSNTNGNEKLTYPIGLITIDEVSFAGGIYDISNNGYYLYTGLNYWTMSPSHFDSEGYAYVIYVESDGDLEDQAYLSNSFGVRPVINLKADTQFKPDGDGSSTNPYIVQ